jgi:hypothetical protein
MSRLPGPRRGDGENEPSLPPRRRGGVTDLGLETLLPRPPVLFGGGGGDREPSFASRRRTGGEIDLDSLRLRLRAPRRRGGGELNRLRRRRSDPDELISDFESASEFVSELVSESEESEESESDDSASSIARRCSMISLGAF